MFSVKNTRFFVTFICCVSFVSAEEKFDKCHNKYEVPEWLDTPCPLEVGIGINRADTTGTSREYIFVQVRANTPQTVYVTLFADPFADGRNGCRPATDVYDNLTKHITDAPIHLINNEIKQVDFFRIFSGCYYIELTNSNNEKWIWKGIFFSGTHHYNDTSLKCSSKWIPASSDRSMELEYYLSLGLTCSQLRCQLYQLETVNNQTIYELDHGLRTPAQDCDITYEKYGSAPGIKCLYPSDQKPELQFNSKSVKTNGREGWNTSLVWKHLNRDGGHYYVKFLRKDELCQKNYSEDDLRTWNPVVRIGAIIYGYENRSNTPLPKNTSNDFLASIVGIVTGIMIIAILVYWLVRYAKIMVQRKHVSVDFDAQPQIGDAEAARLNIGKSSDGILLVYAKGSPRFMEKMREFRSYLQKTCGSKVHDVYSPDDFPELARIGVSDWVKQRLSGDSKVVWVDTPDFRSLCNGEPHPNTSFRDNAIPYAVKLATDLFQDPATQYCRHFVVRMESLQVENGHADPLLVVSPHKRYYIPQHLDKLCDHLTK